MDEKRLTEIRNRYRPGHRIPESVQMVEDVRDLVNEIRRLRETRLNIYYEVWGAVTGAVTDAMRAKMREVESGGEEG